MLASGRSHECFSTMVPSKAQPNARETSSREITREARILERIDNEDWKDNEVEPLCTVFQSRPPEIYLAKSRPNCSKVEAPRKTVSYTHLTLPTILRV